MVHDCARRSMCGKKVRLAAFLLAGTAWVAACSSPGTATPISSTGQPPPTQGTGTVTPSPLTRAPTAARTPPTRPMGPLRASATGLRRPRRRPARPARARRAASACGLGTRARSPTPSPRASRARPRATRTRTSFCAWTARSPEPARPRRRRPCAPSSCPRAIRTRAVSAASSISRGASRSSAVSPPQGGTSLRRAFAGKLRPGRAHAKWAPAPTRSDAERRTRGPGGGTRRPRLRRARGYGVASLAQRKPTFGPASTTEPQSRVLARARLGEVWKPPPRSVWLAPDRGATSPRCSEYQSWVHSSTFPDRSSTP